MEEHRKVIESYIGANPQRTFNQSCYERRSDFLQANKTYHGVYCESTARTVFLIQPNATDTVINWMGFLGEPIFDKARFSITKGENCGAPDGVPAKMLVHECSWEFLKSVSKWHAHGMATLCFPYMMTTYYGIIANEYGFCWEIEIEWGTHPHTDPLLVINHNISLDDTETRRFLRMPQERLCVHCETIDVELGEGNNEVDLPFRNLVVPMLWLNVIKDDVELDGYIDTHALKANVDEVGYVETNIPSAARVEVNKINCQQPKINDPRTWLIDFGENLNWWANVNGGELRPHGALMFGPNAKMILTSTKPTKLRVTYTYFDVLRMAKINDLPFFQFITQYRVEDVIPNQEPPVPPVLPVLPVPELQEVLPEPLQAQDALAMPNLGAGPLDAQLITNIISEYEKKHAVAHYEHVECVIGMDDIAFGAYYYKCHQCNKAFEYTNFREWARTHVQSAFRCPHCTVAMPVYPTLYRCYSPYALWLSHKSWIILCAAGATIGLMTKRSSFSLIPK